MLMKKTRPMLQLMIKKQPFRIVFIGNRYERDDDLKVNAEKNNHYYINPRWLEGFLVNAKELHRLLHPQNNLPRRYYFNKRLKALLYALKSFPLKHRATFAVITNTSEQRKILRECQLYGFHLFLVFDPYSFTTQKVDMRLSPYPTISSEKSIGSALFLMFLLHRLRLSNSRRGVTLFIEPSRLIT